MILTTHYRLLSQKWKSVFWIISILAGLPTLVLLGFYLANRLDLFANGILAGIFITLAAAGSFSLVQLFKSALYYYIKETEYRGHLITYPIALIELFSVIAVPGGLIIAIVTVLGG
jgi:hypothetical protein